MEMASVPFFVIVSSGCRSFVGLFLSRNWKVRLFLLAPLVATDGTSFLSLNFSRLTRSITVAKHLATSGRCQSRQVGLDEMAISDEEGPT